MALPFVVTLRGYDMRQVEDLFARADEALAADSPVSRASARDTLRTADLRLRLRGYAVREVDDALAQRLRALACGAPNESVPERSATVAPLPFTVTVGGYDMRQVESLLAQADEALAADSQATRASARDTLRTATLRRALRGYARRDVDAAITERLQR
ncbi:hypothetical protein [Micromonospora sp. WMMD998]|uniref:hypothetical protein n=1 Tax=Micromonospora sp. WMMD998 TaxID=3016092 RepID=UPI00249C33EE|nr:hypothetical protein [Micromonospora sp. WMMD998]WFE41388.1 hypothetical protein O7619_24205 [Micromonospora sp. WMMD998]